MPESKNLATIRRWVTKNRPDILPQFDQLIKTDAAILLMTIGFESGRLFQSENPGASLDDRSIYLN